MIRYLLQSDIVWSKFNREEENYWNQGPNFVNNEKGNVSCPSSVKEEVKDTLALDTGTFERLGMSVIKRRSKRQIILTGCQILTHL